MPADKIRVNKAIKLIERKLKAGLEGAASAHAEIYRDLVNIPVEVSGDSVIRSVPGEYPRKETGQGQDSIDYGVEFPHARSGVKGEGIHLVHLSHGRHWISKAPFNRLGMDEAYINFADLIAESFELLAEDTK